MIRHKTVYSFDNIEKIKELINMPKEQAPIFKENLPLNNNTWTYLTDINGVQMKGTTGFFTWVRKQFDDLSVGDIIKINCEVYNISGTKVKISINDKELSSKYEKRWEILNITHVVDKNYYNEILFGLWLNDVGEFIVKELKIEVLSQRTKQNIIESGTINNQHFIKYADGTMECFGNQTVKGIANKTWGNLYYIDIPYVRYAKDFISEPIVTISGSGIQSGFLSTAYPNDFTLEDKKRYTPKVEFYRPIADTISKQFEFDYKAKGRWFE